MSADGLLPSSVVQLVPKDGELGSDSEPESYRATTYRRDGKADFLDVQGRDGGGVLLPYRAVLSVAYTALPGGVWQVQLTTPGQALLIEGRHLGELVKRIQIGDVDAIHEFDPARWPEPAETEAVVTALSLTTAQPAPPPA